MTNFKAFLRLCISIAACSIIWAVPRLSLFTEPLMLCDDYVSASVSNMYDVYFIHEFRPLGGIYPMLGKFLFPDFFSSSIPLVLNGLLVGVLGVILLRILANIGTTGVQAWLLTSCFLVHPVINDFTGWNSVGFHVVACIMALSGILLAWQGTWLNVSLGAALLTCSILSYQLFLPVAGAVAVLLFVHHGCLHQKWNWRRFWCMTTALGCAAILFVSYCRLISPLLFGAVELDAIATARKIDFPGAFAQTVALYLNIFCAPLCYSLGIELAMRSWYLIASTVYGAGSLILLIAWKNQRIRLPSACLLIMTWVLLPLATAFPLWITSIYTDWRISMVILFPLMFVVGSMLAVASTAKLETHSSRTLRRFKSMLLALSAPILIVLAASTRYDCRLRVDDFRHDQKIIAAIRTAPERLGIGKEKHRVLFMPAIPSVIELHGDERLFTEGSRAVVGYSTLSYGSEFPLHMLRWNSIEASLTDQGEVDHLTGPRVEECIFERVSRLPYVLHFPTESTSVVVGTEQHKSWVLIPKGR